MEYEDTGWFSSRVAELVPDFIWSADKDSWRMDSEGTSGCTTVGFMSLQMSTDQQTANRQIVVLYRLVYTFWLPAVYSLCPESSILTHVMSHIHDPFKSCSPDAIHFLDHDIIMIHLVVPGPNEWRIHRPTWILQSSCRHPYSSAMHFFHPNSNSSSIHSSA
jgi:hypothetical protein